MKEKLFLDTYTCNGSCTTPQISISSPSVGWRGSWIEKAIFALISSNSCVSRRSRASSGVLMIKQERKHSIKVSSLMLLDKKKCFKIVFTSLKFFQRDKTFQKCLIYCYLETWKEFHSNIFKTCFLCKQLQLFN